MNILVSICIIASLVGVHLEQQVRPTGLATKDVPECQPVVVSKAVGVNDFAVNPQADPAICQIIDGSVHIVDIQTPRAGDGFTGSGDRAMGIANIRGRPVPSVGIIRSKAFGLMSHAKCRCLSGVSNDYGKQIAIWKSLMLALGNCEVCSQLKHSHRPRNVVGFLCLSNCSFAGVSGQPCFVKSAFHQTNGPHAHASSYDGKHGHKPLGITIPPRIELAGYRLRDIVALALAYLIGSGLSFAGIGWITRPRRDRKNDHDGCK